MGTKSGNSLLAVAWFGALALQGCVTPAATGSAAAAGSAPAAHAVTPVDDETPEAPGALSKKAPAPGAVRHEVVPCEPDREGKDGQPVRPSAEAGIGTEFDTLPATGPTTPYTRSGCRTD